MHENSKRKKLGSPPGPASGLTIAGSDCSGGAGLQADLKTFAAFKIYGMSIVTCVVAENPNRVLAIEPISEFTLRHQFESCLKGMEKVSTKLGMLHSEQIIRLCQAELRRYRKSISQIVIDPVMVATAGVPLLQVPAIDALSELIIEHADLITPNLDEAQVLFGSPIKTRDDIEKAAATLGKRFRCAVLLKGGHLQDPFWASDFFWQAGQKFWLRSQRVQGVRTHGTGCTYSAAICAQIALGQDLPTAVRNAKRYITDAIRNTQRFGPWMALGHLGKS